MNTQIDSKPSAVLIESYNERLRKFLLPEDVQNATITVGESDSDGVATATITIPGKKTITTKIKRLNVDSTAPLTSVPELGGEKFMRLLMDDMDAVRVASSDIMNAIGIRTPDDIANLPLEDQVTLEGAIMLSAAIWIKEGVFVPPTDIIVDDISNNYSEYLAKNGNVLGVFEVTAKPASLAYMGKTKGMMMSQVTPTIPDVTDVEWTIVEINIASPEDMELLTDPSNYVVSTKSGIITTDRPQLDMETFTGWMSAANYTLKDGETVRVKVAASQIGEVFRLPIFTDVGITAVTEPKSVYYPFKMLFLREEPVNPYPYSLSVTVSKGNYVVTTEVELTGIAGQSDELGFKYLPASDEVHYVDYTYRDGILTINLNGIQTKSYTTDNTTIVVPLLTGLASQELGGVGQFTSEYITDDTNVLPVPTWAIEDEPDTRSIEELPTTVFTPRGDVDGVVNDISIEMDILKTGKWSLRDSSGLEILGMDSGVQETEYLVSKDISRFEYTNLRPVLTTGMLTAGETYTLFADLNSLTFSSHGDATDGIDFTALPEGIKCLRFGLSNRELTVPTVMPASLTNMSRLFSQSRVFNQDLSGWDMSNVTDVSGMFNNATAFNQDISDWDVSSVTAMSGMFENANAFNQDISGWDVSNVTNMRAMFFESTSFDQDLSNWNVSSVTNMKYMFYDATAFNQDISTWNVGSVTDISQMFSGAKKFNQDISGWDVSNVLDMAGMFFEATAFVQDLTGWCVTNITEEPEYFASSTSLTPELFPVWGTCPRGEDGSTPVEPIDPPVEEVPGEFDLDKVTNGDTSGQWTLEVDVESDEVPVASVLTELALTAVNNAYDTTITTADVTSNLEDKTLTIYTLKENASNVTGTLIVTVILNVTPPPVVKFDLNTLTNTGSPGTWIHEYDEGADFNAEALIVANQLVEVINLTFDQVVVTSDLAITAEPPDIISISPSITGHDKLDSMIFVQTKVKPKPIVRFDLSTITNGDEVGVWTLDINEDDLSEVTAQSATQAVLDAFNASSDIQITYDQLDVVKEDTLITVTPSKGGAGVLEGSFIITLNVIVKVPEVPQVLPKDGGVKFTVTYPDSEAANAGITIRIDDRIDSAYTLYENDIVVVNNDVITDDIGGLSIEGNESVTVVTTAGRRGKVCEYIYVGPAQSLRVGSIGLNAVEVNMTSFGEGVSNILFNVPGKLTVPTVLPAHVTKLNAMFNACTTFNQDISMWDTSRVTNMSQMFNSCKAFNQPIGNWNVSKVTDMSRMFTDAYAFNQDLSGWSTSSLTKTESMFNNAGAFNQDISNWNVSSVTDMNTMFNGASSFNQDISAWDVSKVTDMSNMFGGASVFNADISGWDTVNVTDMGYMFSRTPAFNQDLSKWCVPNIDTLPAGFTDNPLLTEERIPVWGTCPSHEPESA